MFQTLGYRHLCRCDIILLTILNIDIELVPMSSAQSRAAEHIACCEQEQINIGERNGVKNVMCWNDQILF